MATRAAALLASAPHREHPRRTAPPASRVATPSAAARRSFFHPAARRWGSADGVSTTTRAIGFDLGERDEDTSRGDVEALALIEDAASVLFLQDPLRHECSQAYLALLQQISLKAGPNKLFSAYGEFFRSLRRSGKASFVDVVLDEIIAGRGNPVAEAVARTGASISSVAPVDLAAVAADLDLLQRLCVSEATILKWCERAAAAASPSRRQPASWVAAASALGVREEGADVGAEGGADGDDALRFTRPASVATIAATRNAVAESWKWSDALEPHLAKHWRGHGLGEPSRGNVLTWHNPKRGATCDDVKHPDAASYSYGANGANDDPDASSDDSSERSSHDAGVVNGVAWRTAPRAKDEPAHAALVSHFAAFANGDSEVGGAGAGHHVLVHGPVGAGKRWLLMSSLGVCLGLQHDTSKSRPSKSPASALRVVRVPREALRQLPELCQFARDHPRARFVFLLDMPLALAPHAEFYNELTCALDGGGGGRWPPNAILAAAALEPTALKPDASGGGLACRFRLSVGV
mmetsp:Transcript_10226/g.46293  ORF Transcript_10226/g.46293 Transcript_10226/m.46293 type:complete len:523 (-) Transcript_10226:187-1755(-)